MPFQTSTVLMSKVETERDSVKKKIRKLTLFLLTYNLPIKGVSVINNIS